MKVGQWKGKGRKTGEGPYDGGRGKEEENKGKGRIVRQGKGKGRRTGEVGGK